MWQVGQEMKFLAAVLTYRNQNKKITLFTSQYTQDDLIKIYTLKKMRVKNKSRALT